MLRYRETWRAVLMAAVLWSGPAGADETQTSIGEIPLCDLGTATVNGFTGGLYPNGTSRRPGEHEAAGLRIARHVVKPKHRRGPMGRWRQARHTVHAAPRLLFGVLR